MGNFDAEQKFFEATKTFKIAEEKARKFNIDANKFRMVVIDLDAAIPGLDGIMLGRALLLKAYCLYWLYLDKISKNKSILDAVMAPTDPLIKEGLSYAMKGLEILEKHGSTVDFPWANGLINELKEYIIPEK
jgi:hypothetical protein